MSHASLSSSNKLLSLEGRDHYFFPTPNVLPNPLHILYSLLTKWINDLMKSKYIFIICMFCADMFQIFCFDAMLIMRHVLLVDCLSFKCARKQAGRLRNWPPSPVCLYISDLKCSCVESSLCQNEAEISTTVFSKKKQKPNFHNSTAFSFLISLKGFCSL